MDNTTRNILVGAITIVALVLIWLDVYKGIKGLTIVALVISLASGRLLGPIKLNRTKEKK